MEKTPRVVLVTRPTDYELLLARHGTRGQAAFFLERRGQSLERAEALHHRLTAVLTAVRRVIPDTWRTAAVSRDDLDRFLFEPLDLMVVVGQDGLVANLAKYLDGQLVIGINPAPDLNPGVLVPHEPKHAGEILIAAAKGRIRVEYRTMAAAELDDGQCLLCLNEVFVGHASHQSARYLLREAESGREERQSSSGLIAATGTGASGWARSIHTATASRLALPEPESRDLTFFVREPWPNIATGSDIRDGRIDADHPLEVVSEMDDGGVIFGDGIEQDHLPFSYGRRVTIRPATRTLNLVAA